MESIYASEMSVPIYQIMLLLVIMTVALLFGFLKLGMFFCYIFVFYWSNIFNIRSIFDNADQNVATASFLFVGFGLIIGFLAMVGFLVNKE